MLFLQGVGVSTSLAVRIYKTYRDASIARGQERAVQAGLGRVGHRLQDRRPIAQAMGIPHDSPQRVKAGLQFTLPRPARTAIAICPSRS